jgi:hypothetical protein
MDRYLIGLEQFYGYLDRWNNIWIVTVDIDVSVVKIEVVIRKRPSAR